MWRQSWNSWQLWMRKSRYRYRWNWKEKKRFPQRKRRSGFWHLVYIKKTPCERKRKLRLLRTSRIFTRFCGRIFRYGGLRCGPRKERWQRGGNCQYLCCMCPMMRPTRCSGWNRLWHFPVSFPVQDVRWIWFHILILRCCSPVWRLNRMRTERNGYFLWMWCWNWISGFIRKKRKRYFWISIHRNWNVFRGEKRRCWNSW